MLQMLFHGLFMTTAKKSGQNMRDFDLFGEFVDFENWDKAEGKERREERKESSLPGASSSTFSGAYAPPCVVQT